MEDLRTSINKQKDLKELKTFLNETFESKKIESKNDLIDYLELTYLPNYKVKIETDNQQFAKYEMSLLTSMYQQAKQRIEFIEKWIVEKKVLISTIQVNEIIDTSKDLPEIEQPFSSQRIKDLFDYLNEWYKDGTNAKYTYIFNLIKHREQPLLNEALYFEYCIKITGIKMVARPQSSALSFKKRDEIERLYNVFLNQLKQ